jgi:RHS repeat-associated protein
MELDNELSGNGNSYTTEFRQYDPRLGRWKSLDPLMAQQPDQSPYKAFFNNPIYWIDPYGGTEYEVIIMTDEKTGKTIKISKIVSDKIRTDGVRNKEKEFFAPKFNYYSYSNVTKYTRTIDGTIIVTKTMEILYNHGIQKTTLWDGVIIDPSDSFEMAGGFYMTGSDGQGTKYYSKNTEYVGNMDVFLAIMSNYSANAKFNIPTKLKENNPAWQGLSDVMDQMNKQGEFIDKVWGIVESVKTNSSNAGIQSTDSQPLSNKTIWRTSDYGQYIGTRSKATPDEIKRGDTLGGNPDIDCHPEKTEKSSKSKL